ncbi:unnamed protein product [Staurois parvus]|uniref:Uncharacterized protein n=1 Tax=Staurois parvus TaxID=386267 RepID=A0ABN9H1W0_9NEOB|nr:unnamed protein product [Staurois parvus]
MRFGESNHRSHVSFLPSALESLSSRSMAALPGTRAGLRKAGPTRRQDRAQHTAYLIGGARYS